jgi:predicted AAA+ superfamily ATPase
LEAVRRFLQEPAGSFFLFGPRGTGKSTWLRQAHHSAYRLDLLDPDAQRLHQARPERLRERVAAEPGIATVVIDEVQKVPALLDVVLAAPRQLESAGRAPGVGLDAPLSGGGTGG